MMIKSYKPDLNISNLYVDNVLIKGNLEVCGTTLTVNSETGTVNLLQRIESIEKVMYPYLLKPYVIKDIAKIILN